MLLVYIVHSLYNVIMTKIDNIMRKFTLFFVALVAMIVAMPMFAQDRNNEDEVVKVNPRQRDYREGEVLVKFKPTSRVNVRAKDGKVVTAVSAVDVALETLGVEECEQLMPLTGQKVLQHRVKSATGAEIVDTDMSKLYRMKFNRAKIQSVNEAIETLKALPEVEYAEPNYIVYSLAEESSGLSEIYCKEPLYSQQRGLSEVGLHYLWNRKHIKTKRSVIAILDTGVDTEHPDLKANIWTNEAEAIGKEGRDDDSNGFKDDIHGWDFVNQTANVRDNNGHGTHCAGIAAAIGNNGKGITGANPDALIMPIAVLQSDGTGDVATIIKGIDYATENGADVLSMSFGGYQYSIAEEQALAKAYAKMVLVAAAGNDHVSISDVAPCNLHGSGRMFPAAFTFVLGVEAGDEKGDLASFSNYDPDGPFFSEFGEEQLYNYELRAPGLGVLSTFPNGQYKALNGTSMACPLVAGAISALLERKAYSSNELLFGDLIYARRTNGNGNVNFKTVYDITEKDRKPELTLVTYNIVDSVSGDGDGRPDAGETLEIYPVLKNAWGQAKNIKVYLQLAEPEDPNIVNIITGVANFGRQLSSYGKNVSVNPLRFKVNKNCVDGRKIRLLVKATCDNMSSTMEQEIMVTAENGVEIGGILEKDMTLYPNVHYIVTSALLVPQGITLTIKPGAVIKFKDGTGFNCEGNLDAAGTPDSMIVFTKTDLGLGNIQYFKFRGDTISYAILENFYFTESYGFGEGYNHTTGQRDRYENCIIRYNMGHYPFDNGNYVKCNLVYNGCRTGLVTSGSFENINFIGNIHSSSLYDYFPQIRNFKNSNIMNNYISYLDIYASCSYYSSTIQSHKSEYPSYLGSVREDILHRNIVDYYNSIYSFGVGYVDLDYVVKTPIVDCHGIVWKVLVNGIDAQDEYELLPPLGVGRHKVEVYFNRPMNKKVAPTISMGVRPPYTQVPINKNGKWNAEGTIYTAYVDITGKMGTDGINRIYVYGAEDIEHFEIPEEKVRFNVQVSSAGSLNTGLMAEAGLGKVSLSWTTDEEDFEDLMGYNIYRFTMDSLNQSSDSVIINSTLIEATDSKYVDYAVVPGTTYYYVIKQMTTSLSTYSLSNAVAATPLSSIRGDANGSMSVDIADVVTQIAYLTNKNPQPFIFEAADINSDGVVNILDVVANINIIINPSAAGIMSVDNTARYTIEDGVLYVESDVALGGLQFRFAADENAEFKVLEALEGFEQVFEYDAEKGEHLFLAYSMVGKTIPAGRHALIEIGEAELTEIILSDPTGKNVLPINGTATNLGVVEQMQISAPYPNPFREQVVVPYLIGQTGEHAVRMVFTDVAGRVIDTYTTQNGFGSYSYTWTPSVGMMPGIYFVSLYVDDRLMQTSKIVYIQ